VTLADMGDLHPAECSGAFRHRAGGVTIVGLMTRLQRQRFSDPIETRTFPNGHVDVVRLDDVVVGRMWFEPGWRWSNDIKPRAGTDRCMNHTSG
jgi:hypothetical protein